MKKNTRDWHVRVASLVFLILAWSISSYFINSRLFPQPLNVIQSLIYNTLEGSLISDCYITLTRALSAFFIAMVLGSIIGISLGRFKRWDSFFDSWVILGLNIPALVVAIMCYIWLGMNDLALITGVVINKLPLVIINLREGTKAIDNSYIQVGKVYQLSKFQVIQKIILPQLYPYFLASTRSGLSLIWKIVLVFELLGRSSGVGFMLSLNFQMFDIAAILAYSLAFITLVLLIEYLIVAPIERKVSGWRV